MLAAVFFAAGCDSGDNDEKPNNTGDAGDSVPIQGEWICDFNKDVTANGVHGVDTIRFKFTGSEYDIIMFESTVQKAG